MSVRSAAPGRVATETCEDLVALAEREEDRVRERLGAPVRDVDAVGVDEELVLAPKLVDDRLSQLDDAGVGGVSHIGGRPCVGAGREGVRRRFGDRFPDREHHGVRTPQSELEDSTDPRRGHPRGARRGLMLGTADFVPVTGRFS
nr:hypothetical protein [Microbacterium testaceum]